MDSKTGSDSKGLVWFDLPSPSHWCTSRWPLPSLPLLPPSLPKLPSSFLSCWGSSSRRNSSFCPSTLLRTVGWQGTSSLSQETASVKHVVKCGPSAMSPALVVEFYSCTRTKWLPCTKPSGTNASSRSCQRLLNAYWIQHLILGCSLVSAWMGIFLLLLSPHTFVMSWTHSYFGFLCIDHSDTFWKFHKPFEG